jgi:hypothetical protein
MIYSLLSFIKPIIRFFLLGLAIYLSESTLIAADNSPEIKVPATAPIVHRKYYIGEREIYGYSPRFTPNVVTFDLHNRPYMRDQHTIQTLREGSWIETNWYNAAKRLLPQWGHAPQTGSDTDERVVFDKDGCAYTIINDYLYEPPLASHLLFSCDYCKNPTAPTWKAYGLAAGHARIEFNDSRNLLQYPPAILVYDKNVLSIFIPEKTAQNTLVFSKPVLISQSSLLEDAHSGAGNAVVSIGDKIHIVWAGSEAIPDHDGTPQYAVTYDHSSKKLSEPALLGFGGRGKPDSHCAPVITADSKNYLHVVLGAHTTKLQYIKSLEPNSTSSGWTEAVDIGKPSLEQWGDYYTYVALCCDSNDTLHVVARMWSGEYGRQYGNYKEYLAYLRKQKDKPWDAPKPLVVPFHQGYSIYYHKLNIDRKGRLFVNYMYYADGLTTEELAAYRAKWPKDKIKYNNTAPENSRQSWNIYPHDPAILMSDDGGNTWRLAVTKDFAM